MLPPSFIYSNAITEPFQTAVRFKSIHASHSSSGSSFNAALTGDPPALFTQQWRPPKVLMAVSARLTSALLSVTSAGTASALPPALWISSATRSILSFDRDATMTVAPAPAILLAIPSPIPCPAPVTTATLPVRSNSFIVIALCILVLRSGYWKISSAVNISFSVFAARSFVKIYCCDSKGLSTERSDCVIYQFSRNLG